MSIALTVCVGVVAPAADATQTPRDGLKRIFALGNANLDIDGVDDQRVDANVAILDIGIDLEDPDLNIADGLDCTVAAPPDYACDSDDPDDGDIDGPPFYGWAHGTNAAKSAAAIDNGIDTVGVAPGARIWSIAVSPPDTYVRHATPGTISTIDLDAVIGALKWAIGTRNDSDSTNDIHVMSSGLGPECPPVDRHRIVCPGGITGSDSMLIESLITQAVNEGIVFVRSSGNWAEDMAPFHLYDPNGNKNFVLVSSMVDTDGLPGSLGPDGNRCGGIFPDGPTNVTDDHSNPGSGWGTGIDVAAPGACGSTSHPWVLGAAAILASEIKPDSRTDVDQIRNALVDTGNLNWTDDSPDGTTEPLIDISDEDTFDPAVEQQFHRFAASTSWTSWSTGYTFRSADVDGDHRADVVGRNLSTPDIQVGLSTGSGFKPSVGWTSWSQAYDLQFADVNGDGRDDIIGRHLSTPDVQVGLSNGSSFAPSTEWTTWSHGYTFQLADVNGDGRADVVGRSLSTPDVQVGLSSGSSFATSVGWTSWSQAYTLQMADVNGDGRADAVGLDSTGDVQVGMSRGGSFAPSASWTTWPTTYSASVSDVNGDGRSDLVGRTAFGDIQVGLSTGRGFAPPTRWTDAWPTGYTVAFADANGDGASDVIGRHPSADVHIGLASR